MSYMKPLIVEKLSKNYRGLQALLDVSFSVEEGERVVIIGPNGAGKTTLFNLISGAIFPSRGRVRIFGKDVTRMSSNIRVHLGLARTFQITNLFPNLTLSRNVILAVLGVSPSRLYMHRSINSFKDITKKAQNLIAEHGLREYQDTLVRNLSYGVQRQIEVIMALAAGAKILLFDEPTAGLSLTETNVLSSMLLGLDASLTLLIIEHDMDVAFRLAHRLIVLHQGQMFAEGSPRDIATNPKVKSIYLGEEQRE
jgi:branched-chain amino acid transport system ATP-binding protein